MRDFCFYLFGYTNWKIHIFEILNDIFIFLQVIDNVYQHQYYIEKIVVFENDFHLLSHSWEKINIFMFRIGTMYNSKLSS